MNPVRAAAAKSIKNVMVTPRSPHKTAVQSGPLEKMVRFLAGFLVSIFAVAILLKLFSDFFWATFLGTLLNGGAAYYMLTKHQENSRLRMVAYGAIAGTILVIAAAGTIWAVFEAAFQGIAD